MILNHLNCLSPRKQNGIGTRKSVGLLKLFEPFSSFPTHIFVHEECRECNACKDFVSVYILVFLVSQICFFFCWCNEKKRQTPLCVFFCSVLCSQTELCDFTIFLESI